MVVYVDPLGYCPLEDKGFGDVVYISMFLFEVRFLS